MSWSLRGDTYYPVGIKSHDSPVRIVRTTTPDSIKYTYVLKVQGREPVPFMKLKDAQAEGDIVLKRTT